MSDKMRDALFSQWIKDYAQDWFPNGEAELSEGNLAHRAYMAGYKAALQSRPQLPPEDVAAEVVRNTIGVHSTLGFGYHGLSRQIVRALSAMSGAK